MRIEIISLGILLLVVLAVGCQTKTTVPEPTPTPTPEPTVEPTPESTATTPECSTLYWYDNTNKSCGARQFCGAYMYLGLNTFSNRSDCLNALAQPTPTPSELTPEQEASARYREWLANQSRQNNT